MKKYHAIEMYNFCENSIVLFTECKTTRQLKAVEAHQV